MKEGFTFNKASLKNIIFINYIEYYNSKFLWRGTRKVPNFCQSREEYQAVLKDTMYSRGDDVAMTLFSTTRRSERSSEVLHNIANFTRPFDIYISTMNPNCLNS